MKVQPIGSLYKHVANHSEQYGCVDGIAKKKMSELLRMEREKLFPVLDEISMQKQKKAFNKLTKAKRNRISLRYKQYGIDFDSIVIYTSDDVYQIMNRYCINAFKKEMHEIANEKKTLSKTFVVCIVHMFRYAFELRYDEISKMTKIEKNDILRYFAGGSKSDIFCKRWINNFKTIIDIIREHKK